MVPGLKEICLKRPKLLLLASTTAPLLRYHAQYVLHTYLSLSLSSQCVALRKLTTAKKRNVGLYSDISH
jgi:hypothetical protein